jgi:hypothetical protein
VLPFELDSVEEVAVAARVVTAGAVCVTAGAADFGAVVAPWEPFE